VETERSGSDGCGIVELREDILEGRYADLLGDSAYWTTALEPSATSTAANIIAAIADWEDQASPLHRSKVG
jgi:hypothetical protein